MKKTLLAAFVGGLILFVWSIFAWIIIASLHAPSIRQLPNDDQVINALRAVGTKGVYVFPAMPQETASMSKEAAEAAQKTWQQKYEQGPRGMIFFDPSGGSTMMVPEFILGLILDIVAAFLAAWILVRSTAAASPFVARVAFVGILGIFISVVTHLSNYNWMDYPLDYTTAMIADTIASWVLAGIGIAAIVKPQPRQA